MGLKLELERLWKWLKKTFRSIEQDVAPLVVSIIQRLRQQIDSGVVDFVGAELDTILKSHLPTEIIAIVKNQLPRILAVALALEELPVDNPTPEDIKAFSDKVIAAVNAPGTVHSKLWTTIATDLAMQIDAFLNNGGKHTFAEWVNFIEASFQTLKIDVETGKV